MKGTDYLRAEQTPKRQPLPAVPQQMRQVPGSLDFEFEPKAGDRLRMGCYSFC